MADLTDKDWSRIYGFLALELKKNAKDSSEYEEYSELKDLLEKDPVQGVAEIIKALNEDYPDNKIEYQPYSDVLSLGITRLPRDLVNQEVLELIRAGKTESQVILRLTC
jgi:hypothetical protein